MITLVLTRVPKGLRGHLNKWLAEVAPGVFVGRASARVRDELWQLVVENMDTGSALMVLPARNEQGYEILNVRHRWQPVDMDGLQVMRRPSASDVSGEPVKSVLPRAARYRWVRAHNQSRQK